MLKNEMTVEAFEVVEKYGNFVRCRLIFLGTSRLLELHLEVTSCASGTYVLAVQMWVVHIFSIVLVVLVGGELDATVETSLGIPIVTNLLGGQIFHGHNYSKDFIDAQLFHVYVLEEFRHCILPRI